MAVGIIAEYNPFHNGHLYHINKTKEMFPNEPIVLIISSCFLQRGESSILNKWDKTEIALKAGIDLVIELPFPFASQSADIFAKGSIQLLSALKVKYLVFGSESGNISFLTKQAKAQLNPLYQQKVREFLQEGINYPTALSKALLAGNGINTKEPNDILGITYIREIITQQANIIPITIKRTNQYHDLTISNKIVSASAIRNALYHHQDITHTVPSYVLSYLQYPMWIEHYFPILKYKILSENHLEKYQTVDEGIENRIYKYIVEASTLQELVTAIKTKRYTYNKIMRMLTHILCNFTKEEAQQHQNIEYIRILGFSSTGRTYLNKVKKQISLPIISNYANDKDHLLALEFRILCIYASILPEDEKQKLIKREYCQKPIMLDTKKEIIL